ncbi:hypothetical protein CVV68_09900 [Arthrobacter livingstonensis]|uniref:DUF222 domain-containing protein n=1 Tax=Arthrobacter livingstonensis TaxID=670078 RepID=A0A2V5L7N8_9MICC|nr:HNH endonuclease signature motif containing protein [Arthrobacter livingstonensis]PYI67409.1 hypothetical protein CVV68_09900 [Arthrobacter livingstonensis]
MNDFQPGTPRHEGLQPAPASWSPAPGIVAPYPVVQEPEREGAPDSAAARSRTAAPIRSPSKLPDPRALARQLATTPHETIAVADLEINSVEALAEAEYLCAVSDLRSLAAIESGLAALKAQTVERLDAASIGLGIVAELDPWQQEILAISTTAELCAALTLPQRSGGELKSQSIVLVRHHPNILAALSGGSISWRNAVAALDELDTLETLRTAKGEHLVSVDELRDLERQLLDLAPGMTGPKFNVQARRLRERAHPESIQHRHVKAVDDRKLALQPGRDGMSWLSMFLPADTAQGIWNQATRTARTLQGPNERRTLTQLRVDALAEWLLETGTLPPAVNGHDDTGDTGFEDAGRGEGNQQEGRPRPRAQVLVTVPLLSLLGHSNEPAELEGYGPIPPAMARKLAAECPTLYRIMVDPYTNEYLSMDPTRYRITGAERTMLRARDGNCVFPCCNTVTDDTELDHILAWEDGGSSLPENLGNECGVHHRLKHFKDGKAKYGSRKPPRNAAAQAKSSSIMKGWTPVATRNPGGKPGWISPAGWHYPPEATASTPPQIPAWIMIEAIEELRGEL